MKTSLKSITFLGKGWLPILMSLSMAVSGCGGDDGKNSNGNGNDSGTPGDGGDGDADADADAGHTCTPCEKDTCLATVTGKVLYDNGQPAQGKVQVCIKVCSLVPLNTDGTFTYYPDILNRCTTPLLDQDVTIDVALLDPDPQSPGMYARYACAFHPATSDIQTVDGVRNYDVGTFTLYALPADGGVPYTPDQGATVDLQGVSFTVPAGGLGTGDATIKVFKFPAGAPRLCFDTEAPVDALYFLAPYGATFDSPLPVTVEAPSGYQEGDKVRIQFLGDFINGEYLFCGNSQVDIGTWSKCTTGVVTGGAVTSDPNMGILRFSWMGIAKVSQ